MTDDVAATPRAPAKRSRLASRVRSVARWADSLAEALGYLAALACLLLLALLMAEVFQRGFRNSTVPGSVPIAEFLLSTIFFGGLAYAQKHGAHIRVEVLHIWMSGRALQRLEALVLVAGAGLLGLFGWAALVEAMDSLARGEYTSGGAVEFPRHPARFAVAVGFFANGIVTLLQAVSRLVLPLHAQSEPGSTEDPPS